MQLQSVRYLELHWIESRNRVSNEALVHATGDRYRVPKAESEALLAHAQRKVDLLNRQSGAGASWC